MSKPKIFTAVFRDVTTDEAGEIVNHAKWSAGSWSHALDDRDDARHALEAANARIAELEAQIATVAPAVDAQPVARVCVESLKPGQEFNTKYYGRVRFIRWDHYMGQRTAEIEKLDFGGRCNPLPETLQESIDACASAQSERLRKDAERREALEQASALCQAIANGYVSDVNPKRSREAADAAIFCAREIAALSQHTGEKDD